MISNTSPRTNFVYLRNIAILAVIYFIAGKFGLSFEPTSGFATLVWPPSGIAFAALFIFGLKLWPGILAGAFLVNLTTGAPLLVALGMGTGNMLEAVVGVYLFRRFTAPDSTLENPRGAILFIIFAALFSTAVSATIGVTSLLTGGIVTLSSYSDTWKSWWVGDALGNLIFGSFLIVWLGRGVKNIIPPIRSIKLAEALILILFLFGMLFAINLFVAFHKMHPVEYLVFLPLIWAALRFGQRGSVTTTLILSSLTIWGTIYGFGPFAQGALMERLLFLQLFIAVFSVTGMILASYVSAREQLNKKLQDRLAEDEAILTSIGDGLVVVDKKGRILLVNKAFEDLLDLKAVQIIGKPAAEVIQIENESGHRISYEEELLSIALSEKPIVRRGGQSIYIRRRDTTRFPISAVVTSINMSGEVIGAVGTFRDITKEKELERAKSDFIAIASHEMRTPLTLIKGNAERLLKIVKQLSQKETEMVTSIYENSNQLFDIINDFLDVIYLEGGRFFVNKEKFDVVPLLRQMVPDFEKAASEKNLYLKLENLKDSLPSVVADKERIKQVVGNLLANAIQYTNQGGVSVVVKAEDKFLKISVADTGIGIAPKDAGRLFKKFSTIRETFLRTHEFGSGMGLYISRLLIESMGGKIWLQESTPGVGSTFSFTLPVAD